MEAIAKHEFRATAGDELSFVRGARLKILSTEEDKNWYKAEFEGREGFIPSNYIDIKPPAWFINGVTRQDAEEMLLERNPSSGSFTQKDGAFLVRPSETSKGDFSISVKFADQVQHFKVMRDQGGYYVWQKKFDSINELVKYHRTASVSRTQIIYLQDMTRAKVIASYDFKPQDAEELELKRGDIIFVLDKKDPNWWMGEIVRGTNVSRGLFPKTYVSPYTD
jgi:growth factor receptor-binding protein 2